MAISPTPPISTMWPSETMTVWARSTRSLSIGTTLTPTNAVTPAA
jgi:hypothetical protein